MSVPPLRWVTIAAVADRLSVSIDTVRRWVKKGELPVFRAGGVQRIAENDVEAFIRLRTQRSVLPRAVRERHPAPRRTKPRQQTKVVSCREAAEQVRAEQEVAKR